MTTLSAFTVTAPFDDRQSERPAHWQDDAACTDVGPTPFFPEKGESPEAAKRICARCPVKAHCLQTALDDPDIVGVWGETTTKRRGHGLRAGLQQPRSTECSPATSQPTRVCNSRPKLIRSARNSAPAWVRRRVGGGRDDQLAGDPLGARAVA